MTDKKAAKEFVKRWRSILAEVPAGKNNEQQDTQKFWIDLLVNVLGVPAASAAGPARPVTRGVYPAAFLRIGRG